MIKNNKLSIDPATKENIKNKINEEIQKMKLAETKGDNEAIEKIMILNERIRLIDSYRPFDQIRIANLEKMFRHYSTHVFKTGKNMTFEQIEYENEHMTLQRFFVFINDFKLNQIPVDDVNKQLTDRNNIILLFKKCSYNSRYLEFHEFITALQRLFVLLFNETQNFDRRQQKLKAEKLKRAKQSKKREQLRAQKLKKKKEEKYMDKPPKSKEEEEEQQQQQEEDGEVEVTQNNKTNQIKPAPQQPGQNGKPPSTVAPSPALPKSTQNDEMVKEMMKDFQIVNPTDEVKKAVKKVKNNKKAKKQQQEQSEQQQVQIQVIFDPYAITDEQKIQSYMLRLGVDNFKNIEKKMRYFEKANQKYHEVDLMEKALEIKRQKLKILKKDQLTHYENGEIHPEWKGNRRAKQQVHIKSLLGVRDKIEQIKMSQSRSHMVQSLPKEVYERKKRSIIETFQRKQRQLMVPYALSRLTKRKQQEQENTLHYSLQMIHRSTPNQLPVNKINPEKYAISDPSDHIFMEEYGYDSVATMRVKPRSDLKLAEDTKRRAQELESQQQKKMNLLSRNMYKKQKHYNRQATVIDKNF